MVIPSPYPPFSLPLPSHPFPLETKKRSLIPIPGFAEDTGEMLPPLAALSVATPGCLKPNNLSYTHVAIACYIFLLPFCVECFSKGSAHETNRHVQRFMSTCGFSSQVHSRSMVCAVHASVMGWFERGVWWLLLQQEECDDYCYSKIVYVIKRMTNYGNLWPSTMKWVAMCQAYFCSSKEFAAGVWKGRFWDFGCNCLRNHLSLVCNMEIAHCSMFHGQNMII